MSYSLPSISFCKQLFVSPQRSQIIISFPLLRRNIRSQWSQPTFYASRMH
jgi:hypothetical protein